MYFSRINSVVHNCTGVLDVDKCTYNCIYKHENVHNSTQ